MNHELYEKSKEHEKKIENLRKIIENCDDAIKEIEHGADIFVKGYITSVQINSCMLDDGQESLMQKLMIGILKDRMEEAEVELIGLLPKEPEETPFMDIPKKVNKKYGS